MLEKIAKENKEISNGHGKLRKAIIGSAIGAAAVLPIAVGLGTNALVYGATQDSYLSTHAGYGAAIATLVGEVVFSSPLVDRFLNINL